MTRELTSTVLFQSYIALGLEPGAPWQAVQQRHKDLIMAWHPDRFVEEKQKGKAEDELKKINSARDTLRRHFHKEHKPGPTCSCQATQASAQSEPVADEPKRQPQQWAQGAQAKRPWSLVKSQAVATAALFLLSLLTLAVYHHFATRAASRAEPGNLSGSDQKGTELPNSTATDLPVTTGSDLDNGQGGPAAEPVNDQAPAAPAEHSVQQAHTVPGTFYAGFVKRQEKRKQLETEARRLELTKQLAAAKQSLATANAQLADLQKKLPALERGITEQQTLIKELERLESDLNFPTSNSSPQHAYDLYNSNPEYQKHVQAMVALAEQKKWVEEAIVRVKMLIEQSKAACQQIKLELP